MALIWSPGFLQVVAQSTSASERAGFGTEARNASSPAGGMRRLLSNTCKDSGERRPAVMASGHLDHKEDSLFTCCIRLMMYDVSWMKTVAPPLGCDKVDLVYFKWPLM